MRSSTFVAAAVAAMTLTRTSASFVSIPWPTPSKTPLAVTMGYGTVNSTGTRFNWYIAVLDDLSRFSVELPARGCAELQTTTATAIASGCVVGLNSGFFQFSPKPTYCLGELIIASHTVEWAGDGSPLVAVTHNATLIGPLTKAEVASEGVVFGVSGFGVIVSDGKPSASGIAAARAAVRAVHPGAEEIAPRTVFAVDAAGRLLLVSIDGVERLLLGVTLTEASEIFSGGSTGFPFLATHAVNMDGGGSTTFVAAPAAGAKPQVYNRPTDTDTGPVTERAVTSIACIKA